MAQTRKASGGSATAARRASGSSRAAATQDRAASNGGGSSSALNKTAFSIATAMAGAAVGMALGQRQAKRPKKVLGISIPGTGGGGTDGLAKNVGEASKQLARLADEVRTTRKKAEEIGKALS